MILFEQPRETETHFLDVVRPDEPAPSTDPSRHRYFCLTPLAWESLKLAKRTGSPVPCWPTSSSAHLYLRNYLGRSGWSYDAIVAYFLHLFRPEDAYISNLAKCFPGQGRDVFHTCMARHLAREMELFAPTLVVSFTWRLRERAQLQPLMRAGCLSPEVLGFLHPRARGGPGAKIARVRAELESKTQAVEAAGRSVGETLKAWETDSGACLDELACKGR